MLKKNVLPNLFQKRAILSAALLMGFQLLAYALAKPFVEQMPHFYDLSLHVDALIPYAPAFFVPYFLCFAYWPLMYLYLSTFSGRRLYAVAATSICASVMCFILFLLIPTSIERPKELGEGFFGFLAALAYGADTPYNLFPSFHCFTSWLCFVGVRGVKGLSPLFKAFTLFAALLVFASTMLVKQHFFVDFIPSVLLAEFFWLLSWKTGFYKPFGRVLERVLAALRV